jgi:hypothetical protein
MDGQAGAWRTGVRWGIGHSAGVLGVGLLAPMLRHTLAIEALSAWGERCVGIVLDHHRDLGHPRGPVPPRRRRAPPTRPLVARAWTCGVRRRDAARVGRQFTAKRAFTVAAMAMMGLTIYDVIGRTLYFRLISIAIMSVAAIGLLVSLAHLRYHALA